MKETGKLEAIKRKMKSDYSDIIDKKRPEHDNDDFSIRHPKMDILDRAKIFASFDALRGFDEEIDKENILYAPYIYLSEDEKQLLDQVILIIDERIEKREEVRGRITYFIADGRSKDTGTVMEVSGVIKKLDKINGTIKIGDDIILVKNIYDINLEDHKDEI